MNVVVSEQYLFFKPHSTKLPKHGPATGKDLAASVSSMEDDNHPPLTAYWH